MARLWTALLLLAAVFAVHGIQCTAASSTLEHGSASVGVPAAATQVGAPVAAMSGHGHLAAPQAAGDAGATGLPDPRHDAHVLAVCLAVVLAGLTVLGAVARLRGRAIPLVRGSPSCPRWTAGWSRQPRPPDLSALCLLRI